MDGGRRRVLHLPLDGLVGDQVQREHDALRGEVRAGVVHPERRHGGHRVDDRLEPVQRRVQPAHLGRVHRHLLHQLLDLQRRTKAGQGRGVKEGWRR